MRSGNTDAKLSVQIITLLKLAIKSLNQIFLEIQLVDTDTTQSWWISTTLFHFLTELIVMNPSYLTYFNSTILPTINAMNDNTQFSQSDQYKAYRTNLLQSVFDQFNYPYSNIRSIYFVWYPKRRIKDISKRSDELSSSTLHATTLSGLDHPFASDFCRYLVFVCWPVWFVHTVHTGSHRSHGSHGSHDENCSFSKSARCEKIIVPQNESMEQTKAKPALCWARGNYEVQTPSNRSSEELGIHL